MPKSRGRRRKKAPQPKRRARTTDTHAQASMPTIPSKALTRSPAETYLEIADNPDRPPGVLDFIAQLPYRTRVTGNLTNDIEDITCLAELAADAEITVRELCEGSLEEIRNGSIRWDADQQTQVITVNLTVPPRH